jgi:hypothetical protein
LPKSAPKIIRRWVQGAGIAPVLILINLADSVQDLFM